MNQISNFLSGKAPLWQSFWIGGIGGLVVLFFIFVTQAGLDMLLGYWLGFLISTLIICVLFILISLGVFRSANNYSGSK